MKVFIVLAAFVGVASAGYGVATGGLAGGAYGGPAVSLVPTGQSSQFRSEDNYGNFQFGYDESHATGGSSRREEGSGHVRRGSYSLSDADGRRRTVDYVADETGFHADVKTNEPGVEPRDPADVLINKSGHNVVGKYSFTLHRNPLYHHHHHHLRLIESNPNMINLSFYYPQPHQLPTLLLPQLHQQSSLAQPMEPPQLPLHLLPMVPGQQPVTQHRSQFTRQPQEPSATHLDPPISHQWPPMDQLQLPPHQLQLQLMDAPTKYSFMIAQTNKQTNRIVISQREM